MTEREKIARLDKLNHYLNAAVLPDIERLIMEQYNAFFRAAADLGFDEPANIADGRLKRLCERAIERFRIDRFAAAVAEQIGRDLAGVVIKIEVPRPAPSSFRKPPVPIIKDKKPNKLRKRGKK